MSCGCDSVGAETDAPFTGHPESMTVGEWRSLVGEVGPEDPPGVGAVSSSELDALNNAVQKMSADVNEAARKEREAASRTSSPLSEFQMLRWTPFVLQWNAFFIAHQTFISGLFQDPEFAAQKGQYEKLREEFLQLGQATDAPPASSITEAGQVSVPWSTLIPLGLGLGGIYWLLAMGGLSALTARRKGSHR